MSTELVGRYGARWVRRGGLGDRDRDLAQPALDLKGVQHLVFLGQEAQTRADHIALAGVLARVDASVECVRDLGGHDDGDLVVIRGSRHTLDNTCISHSGGSRNDPRADP